MGILSFICRERVVENVVLDPKTEQEMKALGWKTDDPEQVNYYVRQIKRHVQNVQDASQLAGQAPTRLRPNPYVATPASDQARIGAEHRLASAEDDQYNKHKVRGPGLLRQLTKVVMTGSLVYDSKKQGKDKPEY